MKPSIYLAGAIRDGNDYDVKWRQDVERNIGYKFHLLNPLAGKSYDDEHGWLLHKSVKATGDIFVPRDLHMIHKADFILANLLPLAAGYPSIGTLMELGVALERRILTVVVGGYAHCHHPFIAATAYRRVATVDAAIDWLKAEADTWL